MTRKQSKILMTLV